MSGSRGPSRGVPFVFKLLLAVLGVAIPALVVEGGYSLLTGRSLIRRFVAEPEMGDAWRLSMQDRERMAAAALTKGAYARSRDLHVGFTMKAKHRREIVDVEATTDAYGMRNRPGPPPEPGAPRIVVLGDSVAFGYGVADDETMGHQLEELLGATMAEEAAPPVVFTVACPGWSFRNEARYLKNHLARLDPDVVLLVPVLNDLDDTMAVIETGHAMPHGDPVVGARAPDISNQSFTRLAMGIVPRLSGSWAGEVQRAGGRTAIAPVHMTGVTRESRRRWQELLSDLGDLQKRIEARGGHLAVTHGFDDEFARLHAQRVHEALPDLPKTILMKGPESVDGLEKDAHPNARCHRAIARRMAEFLLEKKWIPGAGARPLEAEDSRYAERRARFDPDRNRRLVAEQETRWRSLLGSSFDLLTGERFHQVYGGVDPDGMVGPQMMAVLVGEGARTLTVRCVPLPKDSGVYPLEVSAWVGGAPCGTQRIAPPTKANPDATLTFDVVPEARKAGLWDVTLRASNWVTERHRGITRQVAFRLWQMRVE